MISKHTLRNLSVVAASVFLTGCVATFPLIARFDDFNEIAYGTVKADMRGRSIIFVATKNLGLTCSGASQIVSNPYNSCVGQQGVARLECSDGRIVEATFTADTCTSGSGAGKDQNGNTFHLAFGFPESAGLALINEASKSVAKLPDLPVYRPKEVRKEKGFSTGTGFFVSTQGHLITNFHVIDGSSRISILWNGKELSASIEKVDPANDLALIKVDSASQPIIVKGAGSLARADEVFTLGYPLIIIQGQNQKASFGRINALSGIQDDVRFLQIDVPIQPGNSGGPLFDSNGEVIGVVTATLDQLVTLQASGALPQNVNFAVKADYVLPLLSGISLGTPKKSPSAAMRPMRDSVIAGQDSVVLVVAR